jgi:hypothetical protein
VELNRPVRDAGLGRGFGQSRDTSCMRAFKRVDSFRSKTLQSQLDMIWKGVRTVRPLDTQHIGVYTWQLDRSLPGLHIAGVYNTLTAEEASILAQCRTRHSRLQTNLYPMKFSDAAGCLCGATRGTITHVIYECPLLLRRPAGCYRGSRTYVETPILHTRRVKPLGRSKN